jgi:hypothetical protein
MCASSLLARIPESPSYFGVGLEAGGVVDEPASPAGSGVDGSVVVLDELPVPALVPVLDFVDEPELDPELEPDLEPESEPDPELDPDLEPELDPDPDLEEDLEAVLEEPPPPPPPPEVEGFAFPGSGTVTSVAGCTLTFRVA